MMDIHRSSQPRLLRLVRLARVTLVALAALLVVACDAAPVPGTSDDPAQSGPAAQTGPLTDLVTVRLAVDGMG